RRGPAAGAGSAGSARCRPRRSRPQRPRVERSLRERAPDHAEREPSRAAAEPGGRRSVTTNRAFPSDLEIARAARLDPIAEVAARAGLPEDSLEPYGRYVAKLTLAAEAAVADRPRAK